MCASAKRQRDRLTLTQSLTRRASNRPNTKIKLWQSTHFSQDGAPESPGGRHFGTLRLRDLARYDSTIS